MRETVQYDKAKFRELVVYVAERVGDDARFGDTKFNKVLFHVDFRAYNRLGRAVTGATYQRLDFGPAACRLKPVRRELEHEGAIEVAERPAGPHRQTITRALRPADRSLFTADELALVDEVIDELRPLTAKAVSDQSHEHPGWNLVADRQAIPYSTALISTGPPSDRTLERGRELAARLGW
jgi:hypothetical protein